MFIKRDNLLIHYHDVNPSSNLPVLVLLFGFSMSHRDWADFGYIDKLQKHFRIIAIDPRGCGDSSCPEEASAYRMELLAADVKAVLDHLDIQRAIIWGYSLGAKIALAAAKENRARIHGMILGGFELHSVVDLSNDIVTKTLKLGGHAWRDLWKQLFDLPASMAERIAQVNAPALLALREAERDWPSLRDIPPQVPIPVLLYAGEHCFCREAVQEMIDLFPNSSYLEKEGVDHFQLIPLSDWISAEVIARFGNSNI